jgi:hypothetical protein
MRPGPFLSAVLHSLLDDGRYNKTDALDARLTEI